MLVLFFTVLAGVIGLISYGALDLGGSVTAVIFLSVFSTGAFLRALQHFTAGRETPAG